MRAVKAKWHSKRFGVQLGHSPESVVTNLRFADDILLVGRSLPQIKRMIADVAAEGAKVGLQLHPDKTKILHNNIGYGSSAVQANIDGMKIEVLQTGKSAMYLGRALCLTDCHQVEVEHRIKKAWAKFGLMRRELTDRGVPLQLRLRLFHAVVTPTVLYGSGSWAMTGEREALLRTTQLKMLRKVLGKQRLVLSEGDLETWVDWIKRSTAEVRQLMVAQKIPDWVTEQQVRVQKWSEKLQQMPSDRWAKRALNWKPDGCRSRGRPVTRWTDPSASG